MNIVKKNELYAVRDKKDSVHLWTFIESEHASSLMTPTEKIELKNWINKINRQHHNDGNFLENLRKIFVDNGKSEFVEGQEDIGGVSTGAEFLFVRNSEMGVSFDLSCPDAKTMTKIQWQNYEKMLSSLDVAFVSAKDFHLLNGFDKLNSEVKTKESVKENRAKI